MALSKSCGLKNAIKLFRRAIEIDPRDKEMYFGLGGALEEDGDADGAIENYRRAIEIDPRYAQAHQNLGRVLARPRDFKGAI